jgi:hypothetical protein
MMTRVLEAQADLFEVGILAQTAEVQPVSMEQLPESAFGTPLVVVGSFLGPERLDDLRRLLPALGRASSAVIVVPPFADPDVGRYFETPVGLLVQRRGAESAVRVVDVATAEALGTEVTIRSDHFFDTALGAGVVAVDAQGKPVLIRYQATNTSAPVFFSALQLLSYTALTDEGQRQRLLTHLLSWAPAAVSEVPAATPTSLGDPKADTVGEGVLVPVALLLAAGGPQTEERLCARAQALLGVALSGDDVRRAVSALGCQALMASQGADPASHAALERFLEQRGMHPYQRELADLLLEETTP